MYYSKAGGVLFFLLSLISGYDISAQDLKWFLHVNTGISKTRLTQAPPTSQLNIDWQYDWAMNWGYQGGIRYQYSPRVFLEASIGNTFIRTKESIHQDAIDFFFGPDGTYLGSASRASTFSSNYFNLPISILIKNNRLGFRTGFQTLFFTTSKVTKTAITRMDNQASIFTSLITQEPTAPRSKRLDYGFLLGIQINLSKELTLDVNYYYGLKTHTFENTLNTRDTWSLRNETLSIGLSYSFPFRTEMNSD